ncbi:MAG: hypothetical protein EZS28_001751 [Streblomastix strix]|uniref:Uncharacterized protein n=1 Tax=Streblomastix strix TaxID=222440 RepID=A0A5J4X6D1_9EUKA|nr:MAG: hypothetical protein EZS28_001751 [Streblomastix strix]
MVRISYPPPRRILSSTQTWQNPKGGIGSAFGNGSIYALLIDYWRIIALDDANGDDYIDVDGDRGSSVNIILSKIIDDQFYYCM